MLLLPPPCLFGDFFFSSLKKKILEQEHLTQLAAEKDAPQEAANEVVRICGLAQTCFLQLFHVSTDSNLSSPSNVEAIKRGYKAVRARIHPENLNSIDVPGADRAMAIVEMAYRELLSTASDSMSKMSAGQPQAVSAMTPRERSPGGPAANRQVPECAYMCERITADMAAKKFVMSLC